MNFHAWAYSWLDSIERDRCWLMVLSPLNVNLVWIDWDAFDCRLLSVSDTILYLLKTLLATSMGSSSLAGGEQPMNWWHISTVVSPIRSGWVSSVSYQVYPNTILCETYPSSIQMLNVVVFGFQKKTQMSPSFRTGNDHLFTPTFWNN